MAKKKSYDVVVIGSGSAGFSAASAARDQGARVCIIEKEKLGGECPNYACVPSKALLRTAKVYKTVRGAKAYGISTGSIRHDFSMIMGYRNKVVETITGGGEYGDRYIKLAKKLGIDVVHGSAEFIDERLLEVNGTLYEGKAIVIATGTVDFIPSIKGLDDAYYLGWKEALMRNRQPKSMAIIGGGPVGSEIATFYNAFGTRVILFQLANTILDKEDPEIAKIAHEAMQRAGVEIVTGAKITKVINSRGGVYGLNADIGGNLESFAVDQIVIATGKRSNIKGLNLEETGVELDQKGNIKTNAEKRTSVKHIFAAGDVDGGMQFTHTAHYEGDIAGKNAALTALKKRSGFEKEDQRVVPRVTFTFPEVASVGMTGPQAKEKYKKVLVGRFNMAGLGRSVTEDTRLGLVKIVAHPKTRKVLGGHVTCNRAGEMIHELALAMHLNATIDKLATMIHAYPTYSEGIVEAASNANIE